MTTFEIEKLRDLIHERTGLFFHDDWGFDVIVARLKPLYSAAGLSTLPEYSNYLRNARDEEWHRVITAFSKPTTSFLRHIVRSEMLANSIMPRLAAKQRPIRIWSAGCATGEEPVTAAIALAEAGWFERAEIEIVASDANLDVIEQARTGVYGDLGTEQLGVLRAKYLTKTGEYWKVNAEMHNRIAWHVANLANENEIASLADADVIFCRNVFIYFSDETITRALSTLAKYMRPGGYLITDRGEHFTGLVKTTDCFEEEWLDELQVWKRPKA